MKCMAINLLIAFLLLGGRFQTASTPAKMTKIIAQKTGTGIAADSFAAKPKIYWRASNQYCRVDEEPDTQNGIHGRLIVNEPDAWLVNLADNTAKHVVDLGPTFNCKLPLFATTVELANSKVGQLEFGRELEFFQSNGAKAGDGPKLSFPANYYVLPVGDTLLTLIERSDIHAPILISLIHGDEVIKVRYLLWDDQIDFKDELFAKPAVVKIEEIK